MNDIDIHRAQMLRQQCNRHFAGKRHIDVVGAIQMLTADVLLTMPGMTQEMALDAFDALAGDVRNIIRERFGMAERPPQ